MATTTRSSRPEARPAGPDPDPDPHLEGDVDAEAPTTDMDIDADRSPAPEVALAPAVPTGPEVVDLTGQRCRVVVYDQAGDLGPVVRDALAGTPAAAEVVVCTRPRQLGDLVSDGAVDVLVAGPGLDPTVGLERLRIIREEVPAIALVLVVPALDDLDVRALVRAGAIDVLERADGVVAELPAALARAQAIAGHLRAPAPPAAPTRPEPSVARRVITVASASGGSGKTFLATNLAWFLHRHGGRRTCIIDLDLQFGEVSSALRLRPRYTVADLLQHSDDDDDLVTHFEEFCEVHESGVAVLAAPLDPTEARLVQPGDVGRLIDAARAHFDDVIVDTPPALADTVVASFHRSDELLVMATPDVPSVRNMHVFLSTLDRLDVPRDGLRLLLNKAEHESGVDVSRILKLFPQGFDTTLPYSREVHRALGAGRVVLDSAPDSEVSRRLGDALQRLLPPEAVPAWDEARSSTRSGRLRRLARRERSGS